jgi:hypothetical protein
VTNQNEANDNESVSSNLRKRKHVVSDDKTNGTDDIVPSIKEENDNLPHKSTNSKIKKIDDTELKVMLFTY